MADEREPRGKNGECLRCGKTYHDRAVDCADGLAADLKSVRAKLAETEAISADRRACCNDYKAVIEDLRAEIRRLNVDAQRATAAWEPVHKPLIGGGGGRGCDPTCAARPPHVAATKRLHLRVTVNADGTWWLTDFIPTQMSNEGTRGSSHVVRVEADVPLPAEPATVKGWVAP